MTRRTYFSPSMAVALIALFVALSGSAYAVSQINGKAIKKRTVSGPRQMVSADGLTRRSPIAAVIEPLSFVNCVYCGIL